ncbi:MAG: hypothetical protein EPN91_07135 [Salinibacterium sp.]|nr:MAG: hypothetical protein EPN91_07135 [Salinibacterium sp.]
MTSVLTFQKPGGALVSIRNRELGNTELLDLGQVLGLTDGSQVYAYDMARTKHVYSITLSSVTYYDRTRFETFFQSDALGVFNYWNVTVPGLNPASGEPASTTITNCRFMQPGLKWVEEREGFYAVSFEFYTEVEGATGPPTS